MFFGKSYWKTQEQGVQREWLLTNGIGGFSCGSIIGMNARRYHGLLIASLMPPVERYLILSAISESIHFGRGNDVPKTGEESDLSQEYNQVYYLHAFRTHNFKAHGEYHLESFYYDTVPTFSYRIGSMIIEKSICLRRGMNQVVVVYRIKNQKRRAVVRLTPLVNYRNYHHLSSHSYMTFSTRAAGSKMEITPYDEKRRIFIECSEGKAVIQDKCFFYNMDYPYEHERGLNGTEDHYIPGYFEIGLMPAEEKCITFVCSVDVPIDTLDGEALIRQEAERQKSLMQYQDPGRFQHKAGSEKPDPFLQRLLLAADDFIVYRKSTDSKTIIAGYPWFTDWGRDTMIALPGLTLATKRFEDARNILYTFARYEKYGLIPNVFPDGDGDPAYNTVDAPLWYFDAVYKYIQYTDDIRFVKEQLFDVLERIIHGYIKGTLYQIKMDKDYLIQAGNEDTQLTWMDAKAGNWVVTPRHGKAVEINALWYNALMVMGYIQEKTGGKGKDYYKKAKKVKKAFKELFWNKDACCLYDVVNEHGPDKKMRPNQIIAVSLSFPVIDSDDAKHVVDAVHRILYTAHGLRTLSQDDPQYKGIYIGDQYARDGAYHQGTVWPWLLGKFITAYARVYKNDQDLAVKLKAFFMPFEDHLKDACIGSISEIFDGNEPLLPRGCFAQAWSVAEILRAYAEDYQPLVKHRPSR